MVVEEVVDIPQTVIVELGRLGLWIQALGLIVVLWLAFRIVHLIWNRKKRKEIEHIRDDLKRIEGKLDRVISKKR